MASEWLQRQRRMMHLCIECGEPADEMETGKYYARCWKCREEYSRNQKGSLCWKCIKAVPSKDGRWGCYWSLSRVPVPGWKAKESRMKINDGAYIRSYFVEECPDFVEGRK